MLATYALCCRAKNLDTMIREMDINKKAASIMGDCI